MKKYFYSDGKDRHGPLNFDELKQVDIGKDTLVWFEGLDKWTPAIDLAEMKPILELKPPPIPTFDLDADFKMTNDEQLEKESTFNDNRSTLKTKQRMFSDPFSFEGRIRRTEYGISFIIVVIVNTILNGIVESGEAPIMFLGYIPTLWFLWAQGAKRCHDMGQNGWFQIIPFYVFWMIFAKADSGFNKYGKNPKSH